MNEKLRICYFAPLESIHTIRWLDYFYGRGHDVYTFTGISNSFIKWTAGGQLVTEPGSESQIKTFSSPGYIRAITGHLDTIPGFREPLNLLSRNLNLLKSKRWMRSQANVMKPNIVHALWLGDNSYNAWLTGIHPLLLTVWGSDIRKIATKSPSRQSRIKIALSKADAITSDSDELLELCQLWGAKADRCYRIGVPGIDVKEFSRPRKTGLPERLGVPDGARVILSCRAIHPLYQIHNIVTAFQYVHQKRPETVLLIINYNANPDYLQRVKEKIQNSGLEDGILLVAPLPYEQMPELFAGSHVMVSIPEADGMPQSAYEALAAGCPIVASDLSTYNGIIDNENTGLRVSGSDPQAIAMAILRLLQDDSLRQRLIANGRRLVKERGDIHQEMAKMEQLYYDLLQKHSRLF